MNSRLRRKNTRLAKKFEKKKKKNNKNLDLTEPMHMPKNVKHTFITHSLFTNIGSVLLFSVLMVEVLGNYPSKILQI